MHLSANKQNNQTNKIFASLLFPSIDTSARRLVISSGFFVALLAVAFATYMYINRPTPRHEHFTPLQYTFRYPFLGEKTGPGNL